MNLSQFLQLVAIVVSLGIATWSSIQTNRNIRLANQPYISIYVEFIDTVTASKYIVIKNFGKTSAKITGITYSKSFVNEEGFPQLASVVNSMVAPSQKFMSFIDNKFKDSLTAFVEYEDLNGRKYTDAFPLKFSATDQLLWVGTNTPEKKDSDSDETNAIRAAAHLIAKHMD